MKLFLLKTVVPEFGPCKDVTFWWIKDRPEPSGRPYAELIADYHPPKPGHLVIDAHVAVDESFTEEEARQLKAYLERFHGHEGVTAIQEIELPIPGNVQAIYDIACSVGNEGFYKGLLTESTYDLPFDAIAYYNFEDCELRDGSGRLFQHRYSRVGIDKDGKVMCRPETQDEAAAGSVPDSHD